jgi:alpha-1,2-glucosyltransferase
VHDVPLTDAARRRIHHPFLLADNRHYTFYVWRRVFMLHPAVPYLLVPGYIACFWAWWLRIGQRFIS